MVTSPNTPETVERPREQARAYAEEHYDTGSVSWCAAYDAYLAALSAPSPSPASGEVERIARLAFEVAGYSPPNGEPWTWEHVVAEKWDIVERLRERARAALAPKQDEVPEAAIGEVDRIAKVLMETWYRVDPKSDVTLYPASFVANFADMARAVIAATPKPSPDRVMDGEAIRAALPQTIGRLALGDQLSEDHYCGGSHEMPDGQPIYWQERIGEYPDDIDGYCLTCAIAKAESEAGWCEHASPDARLREENEALRGLLANLEKACDNLATTRSRETYLSMVDRDHATPQLLALDDARKDARAALGGETRA